MEEIPQNEESPHSAEGKGSFSPRFSWAAGCNRERKGIGRTLLVFFLGTSGVRRKVLSSSAVV